MGGWPRKSLARPTVFPTRRAYGRLAQDVDDPSSCPLNYHSTAPNRWAAGPGSRWQEQLSFPRRVYGRLAKDVGGSSSCRPSCSSTPANLWAAGPESRWPKSSRPLREANVRTAGPGGRRSKQLSSQLSFKRGEPMCDFSRASWPAGQPGLTWDHLYFPCFLASRTPRPSLGASVP